MFKLSYLIFLILCTLTGLAQQPHGEGYKVDCAICHSSNGWKVTKADMKFDHSTTRFKLTGQHQEVECKSCHQSLKFGDAKSECFNCHTDMHNNTLGSECSRCHTTNNWMIQNTNKLHQLTRFPLTGNHAITDCLLCHPSASALRFEPLGIECIDCHRSNYNATSNPSHMQVGYSTNCTDCHGVKSTSWNGATFEHGFFPLTGGHQISCILCHKGGSFLKIASDCTSCHLKDYNSAKIPNHIAAGIAVDCKTCHSITTWQTTSFKHASTGFDLMGRHATIVQCSMCHLGNTTSAGRECISCHQVQYNTAKGHVASKFPTDCKLCHNSDNWLQTTFDHNTSIFPLLGAHATIACALCHSIVYVGTSTDCNACHQNVYATAQIPNHIAAGISVDCKTCHTSTTWQTTSFKHISTGFDLTGGHATIVQCSQCHLGNTTSASIQCISCHQVQYNTAKGHVASKFPTDCTLCHSSTNWLQTTFDHNTSIFPLLGAHATIACAMCHATGYVGTSTDCNACHQNVYATAQIPNHIAAGISVDCKTCHTSTTWQTTSFKHISTGFDLTGGHATIVQCSQCHLGNTTSASVQCISCHQVQYNTAPGHVASKFPTDCLVCHKMDNWLSTNFDHTTSIFPLLGAHATTACALCHATGYVGTPTDCNACHQNAYATAQIPSHTAAGISVDCKTCHTSTTWQTTTFKHATTGFDLTGGHATILQCSQCHLGNTTSASVQCVSCHQVQYNTANGHVASKFPTDCTLCHSTTNWLQTTFDHNTSNFPLTGAHTTVACATCHANGYVGTPTACNSCHLVDYNGAANPNHKTLALPLTCADCHTTNLGWVPATFAIHSNYYALTGFHATIASNCVLCHKGGTYPNTPTTCYGCHATDYNNTNNPSHTAAQFPTDCATCHTNVAWSPSTFDHTKYFPIASGRHNVPCLQCHTTPTNYAVFNCIICHSNAHNQSQGNAGCYRCHPTGRGD